MKNKDGSVYEAPVWPSEAEKDANPSVFPDFSKPAARDWWGGLYKILLDVGVAGIWNDMNEPAIFKTATGTMPLDVVHDNEGQPTSHREIHNVYGLLNTRSTYEGLLRLRPDERPFILTRASFAGGQRYSAIWPGDNVSDWTAMRDTIPMFANMGLSGFSFLGADIGGFADAPTPGAVHALAADGRLLSVHARAHDLRHPRPGAVVLRPAARGAEPPRHRAALRAAAAHLQRDGGGAAAPASPPSARCCSSTRRTAASTGARTSSCSGPTCWWRRCCAKASTQREVYLPAGEWFDFWTGRRHAGGRSITVPVGLDSIPIFVRSGAVVFRQPVVQHTGEMPGQPLVVGVYGDRGAGQLYEDDGETLGHTRGAFLRRRYEWSRTGAAGQFTVAAPEGPYRPAARDLVLEMRGVTTPTRVSAGGLELTQLAPDVKTGAGWRVDDAGVLRVRVPDRFEALAIDVAF